MPVSKELMMSFLGAYVLNKIGYWYWDVVNNRVYLDHNGKLIFFDKVDDAEYYDEHLLKNSLDWFDYEKRVQAILDDPNNGNEINEHVLVKEGIQKDRFFSILGAVLSRNDEGKALFLSGILVFNQFSSNKDNKDYLKEAQTVCFWEWYPEERFIRYSKSWYNLIGHNNFEDKYSIDTWVSHIHESDKDKVLDYLNRVTNTRVNGDLFDCFYKFITNNKETLNIISRGIVTKRDEHGNAQIVMGTHSVVSDDYVDTYSLLNNFYRDSLTQCYNRNFLTKFYHEWLNNYENLGLIFCDLCGLKLVNDCLGHSIGDAYIKNAVNIIDTASEDVHYTIRLGGDEFLVIFPDIKSSEELEKTRAKIIGDGHYFFLPQSGAKFPIFISAGCYYIKDKSMHLRDAIDKADSVMLDLKKTRRSIVKQALFNAIELLTNTKVDYMDERVS